MPTLERTMPERAIFTNEPEQYDLSKYRRIYFGNEFCENNFLSYGQILAIILLAKKQGKELTFVTPFVTDKGLQVILKFLDLLPDRTEVVFNDYGLLPHLQRFTPVFGRLLNRQKRGPRIVQLQDKIPKKAWEHFQSSNLEAMEDFLWERDILRAEIDNVIQGFKIKTKLKLSLYYPYVYVSTTRMCLLNGIEDLSRKKISIKPCQRECHKYTPVNRSFPIPLLLKGVTQYYYNGKLPRKGFDRLVFMPEMIA